MLPNIDAQHEDVLAALKPYWNELEGLKKRVLWCTARHPVRAIRILQKSYSSRNWPLDVLSGKADEATRMLLRELGPPQSTLEGAVREDLVADFSIHRIAERLVARFPLFDFQRVRKLHESRRSERLRLTTKQLLTAGLAALAFIGSVVPDAVIQKDLGLQVADFKRWLFFGTVFVLAYPGVLLALEWLGRRQEITRHRFTAGVLEYVDLCTGKSES